MLLKLKQAVIAGHSMGSHIAQRFALDYPERILGLVLIGSFFSFQGKQCVMELSDAVSNLTDPIDRDFALEFQQSTLAKEVPQTFLETVVEESRKTPARVWRAALEGLLETDNSAELYKIKAPTLIVWGDHGCVLPSQRSGSAPGGHHRLAPVGLHGRRDTRFTGNIPNDSPPIWRPLPVASSRYAGDVRVRSDS